MSSATSCTGPSCWSCDAPLVATQCVRSSWHGWKSHRDLFQRECRGQLVRWGDDSGVQDCGVICFACSYIRACCDTCMTMKKPPMGYWHQLGCVAVERKRSITVGVEVTESESFEFSESWSTSVGASADVAATVLGAGVNIGLSGSVAREESRKWSAAWSQTTSTKHTYDWTQPADTCGWTWNVEIADSCRTRQATSAHYELTPTGNPPCCLPGMSVDRNDMYGDCLPDHSGTIVNLCKGTIVNLNDDKPSEP